jgi:hypothetical protein
MQGMIAGRTAGSMPGLDIAEQRAWQNFLDTTLRLHAAMNRTLAASHKLTLADVRLLDILDHSAAGSARMGDLAEVLVLLPSRVTRQIRRSRRTAWCSGPPARRTGAVCWPASPPADATRSGRRWRRMRRRSGCISLIS